MKFDQDKSKNLREKKCLFVLFGFFFEQFIYPKMFFDLFIPFPAFPVPNGQKFLINTYAYIIFQIYQVQQRPTSSRFDPFLYFFIYFFPNFLFAQIYLLNNHFTWVLNNFIHKYNHFIRKLYRLWFSISFIDRFTIFLTISQIN